MSDRETGDAAERARTARDLNAARRSLFVIFGVGVLCVFAATYVVVRMLPPGSLDAAKRASGYDAPYPSARPAPRTPPR